MTSRVLTVAVLLGFAGFASPAAAQAVKLEFHDGQVTLMAQNAPVRTVLAEWARLGGATIVNGDRVAGPPVTLELDGVPERQALDILLRSVAGYMLAPRPAGSAGASSFDRILILPTSAAPRNPPPAPAAVAQPRPIMRPPIIMPQSDGSYPEDVLGDIFPDQPQDDQFQDDQVQDDQMPQVRPGIPRIGAPPRMVMPPQPVGAEPQIVTFDGSEDPQQQEPDPTEGVAPTPANPFGIPFGSSTRPGVITPVPQPADDVQ